MRYYLSLLYCLLLSTLLAAQDYLPPVGQWQSHLPYKNTTALTDAGDQIFVLGNVYPFSFDKTFGSIERYDKVWGLNDVDVNHIAYSKDYDVLVICYENTNIDLVFNGTEIINLSDIQRKSVSGLKLINNLHFEDNLLYISTSFGIVVLDVDKVEFADTYVIGSSGEQVNVNNVALVNDSIFAATAQGIKKAPLVGALLANYQNWSTMGGAQGLPVGSADNILSYNDTLYALYGDSLYQYNMGTGSWNQVFNNNAYQIIHVTTYNEGLLLCLRDTGEVFGQIGKYRPGQSVEYVGMGAVQYPEDALVDDSGILWVADLFNGLVRDPGGSLEENIVPNGPPSISVANMSFANGRLWVAPGGVNQIFNYTFNQDGYYFYESGFWNSQNQFTKPILTDIFNIYSVLAIPGSNVAYYGTFWDGVLKVDGETITKYSKDNSTLVGQTGNSSRTNVGGFALDNEGVLWVSNSGGSIPLHALKPDGTWIPFTPPGGISSGFVTDVILDDVGNKWCAISLSTGQGILVVNYGSDIDNPNDDMYKVLTGAIGNGNLQNNDVKCLVKDNDGEIWAGTEEGIAVFYCPTAIFTDNGCDAQRILVERDGFAGYLLETENVNAIAVDGGNRKWVGTNNGLWLFSPDGTEEIAYFNEDNSPLISDAITSLSIDPETGLVFIGTDKGIMTYRGEATGAGKQFEEEIIVYPNPIKPDYNGPIAIKGLAENSEVHITDANGILIYKTIALGGQAIWDGRDYNGRKAKTGVYLIFATNDEGNEHQVGKMLFIK